MFEADDAVALLERAPKILRSLYQGLPDESLHRSDPGEWSAHTVLIHMATLEDHAWVHRIRYLLENPGQELPPIDRGGPDPNRHVAKLLDDFERLRTENLEQLRHLPLENLTGVHSELGPVTVEQILTTWAVHDLNHIAQAMAAVAGRYREEVGPFRINLGILEH